jgi:uncharacterized delta-60 repeat protein
MKKKLLFLLGILIPFLSWAQDGQNDLSFNADLINFESGANTTVRTTAIQNDGKILIGGVFESYNGIARNGIARLNSNSSLDTTFDPGIGIESLNSSPSVLSLILQNDGKIIIGGTFTSYNGIPRNNIARLHPDGSLDESFDPGLGANFGVESIKIQSDGKIVIGGDFTLYDGVERNSIARLNPDGSVDTNFDPGAGANGTIRTIAIQTDGKILVGGSFTRFDGTQRREIVKLNANGSLDTSFNLENNGAGGIINSINIQSDDKILIAGSFTSFNGTSINRIARINSDGSRDTSFNPGTGPNATVMSTSIQSDGKILIGGFFNAVSGNTQNNIARLNANGSLDTSFNSGIGSQGIVFSILIQSDNKIILGGDLISYNGITTNRIARINPDSTLDLSFSSEPGASETVQTLVQLSDGKILIGGDFTSYNGNSINRIARLNPDGTLDSTFNPGTGIDGPVRSIVLQPDGKIIVGGFFTSFNGIPRKGIVRLNSNGSIDPSFNPGSGINNTNGLSQIFTIVLQNDGKIIISGEFDSFNGIPIKVIARLNPDGSLDTSFNPDTEEYLVLINIAVQKDGKIYIGGIPNILKRLNADGSIDNTFNSSQIGTIDIIRTIAIEPDGNILLGGNVFSPFATSPRIIRLNNEGIIDHSFNPGNGFNNQVSSIRLQQDGKIIVVGNFTSFNGNSINRIARLNSDGSLDSTFNTGTGANSNIWTTTLQNDGKILIGGDFTIFNNVKRIRVNRLLNIINNPSDTEAPSPDLENLPIIEAECIINLSDVLTPKATDNVDGTVQGTTDESIFPITEQGTTVITWTYTDVAGNSSTQTQNIVIADTEAPTVLTQDLEFEIEEGETVTITAENLDAGSFDNCVTISLSLDKTSFTDADEGDNTVTLTVTDVAGNISTGQAIVSIIVNRVPVCRAVALANDLTVILDRNGVGSITTREVDNGSFSECVGGNLTLTLSQTAFSCENLGTNEVTLTATDRNGNVGSTIFAVTVLDNLSPTISRVPRSIRVSLPAGGSYTLPDLRTQYPATDNCTVANYVQNPVPGTVFNLAGTYPITLTATDQSGNVASASIDLQIQVARARGGNNSLDNSSLLSVTWNTPFNEIGDYNWSFTDQGGFENSFKVIWNEWDYNPLVPGYYQIRGALIENISFRITEEPIMHVHVQDKPMATDIGIDSEIIPLQIRKGEVIGTFKTMDPVDDIHIYRMEEHPEFHLEGNALIWKGEGMPPATASVKVYSTDRVGQTISREIQLFREITPNSMLIYPNPAYKETNILVNLSKASDVEIRIFDAAGRLVFSEESFHEESFVRNIDLDQLSYGLYNVVIKINNQYIQGRLVKQ